MNNLDKQYKALLRNILDNGVQKGDRTGTGTISVFGRQIRHKMSDGFPLLTTKKMYFKGIVTELLWFLRGETNIKYLVDNDCNIWNGDAYKNYCKIAGSVEEPDYSMHIDDPQQGCVRLMTEAEFVYQIKIDSEFADRWGDLGPIYGKQWRSWRNFKRESPSSGFVNNHPIDQIANLINTLKTNPDDRRMMVTAWNPAEVDRAVLPPCHYGFQIWTRELSENERWTWYKSKNGHQLHHDRIEREMDQEGVPKRAISLMWNQRSVDTFLGLPFNIASYGLLLEILGKIVNMVPDELVGNLGDTHLYLNHIDQVNQQLERSGYDLPKLLMTCNPAHLATSKNNYNFEDINPTDFYLDNYNSDSSIKAPLSN